MPFKKIGLASISACRTQLAGFASRAQIEWDFGRRNGSREDYSDYQLAGVFGSVSRVMGPSSNYCSHQLYCKLGMRVQEVVSRL